MLLPLPLPLPLLVLPRLLVDGERSLKANMEPCAEAEGPKEADEEAQEEELLEPGAEEQQEEEVKAQLVACAKPAEDAGELVTVEDEEEEEAEELGELELTCRLAADSCWCSP